MATAAPVRLFRPTEFRGDPAQCAVALRWLSSEFPSLLSTPDVALPLARQGEHHMCIEDGPETRLVTVPGFEDAVRRCARRTRFTVWVIAFRDKRGEVHGNALLFDRRGGGCLSRFEPRGAIAVGYTHTDVDKWLIPWAHAHLRAAYASPLVFQPAIGPQAQEIQQAPCRDALPEAGPCVVWSLLFLHLRTLFPRLAIRTIARMMCDMPVSATVLAQAYAAHLHKLTARD